MNSLPVRKTTPRPQTLLPLTRERSRGGGGGGEVRESNDSAVEIGQTYWRHLQLSRQAGREE